jgi:hypothetical protein
MDDYTFIELFPFYIKKFYFCPKQLNYASFELQ